MHFILPSLEHGSRDGLPGLTGCRVQIPRRRKRFLCSKGSRPSLRPTQLRIERIPGALSSRLKQPEPEADHSPLFAVDMKHEFSHTALHSPSWRERGQLYLLCLLYVPGIGKTLNFYVNLTVSIPLLCTGNKFIELNRL